MGIVDKGNRTEQKENFPISGEDEEFNTELALIRVDTLINQQNFLEAIEVLLNSIKRNM